jgi:hypothetical protein
MWNYCIFCSPCCNKLLVNFGHYSGKTVCCQNSGPCNYSIVHNFRTTAMQNEITFQVLTAASMTTAFWETAPHSLVKAQWHFIGAYCLHHDPDDGGSKHLQNVSPLLWDDTAEYPRRLSPNSKACSAGFDTHTTSVTWRQTKDCKVKLVQKTHSQRYCLSVHIQWPWVVNCNLAVITVKISV